MTAWHRRLTVWGLVIFALNVSGMDAWAQSGVLSLRLQSEGPDQALYRLRDGLFLVRGPDSTFVLATEADPDAEVLLVDLRGGSYSIELLSGWRMERTADGETEDVTSRLSSDNPQTFAVTPAETTDVTYTFEVNNPEVGQLQLNLAVEFAPIDFGGQSAQCDPVAQSGCPSGQKCTAVTVQQGSGLTTTSCVASGSNLEGQACSHDADSGFDDCAAGLFCLGGTCERVCDTASEIPGCFCSQFAGVFEDREGVGICQPTCDVLAQDCPGEENCYLNLQTVGQICAHPVPDAGQQGDACPFLNGCDAGYHCVLPDAANTELTCAFACDALGGSPSCADGPGAAFTCLGMNELFSDTGVQTLDDRIGVCVDCSQFPDNPACGT